MVPGAATPQSKTLSKPGRNDAAGTWKAIGSVIS